MRLSCQMKNEHRLVGIFQEDVCVPIKNLKPFSCLLLFCVKTIKKHFCYTFREDFFDECNSGGQFRRPLSDKTPTGERHYGFRRRDGIRWTTYFHGNPVKWESSLQSNSLPTNVLVANNNTVLFFHWRWTQVFAILNKKGVTRYYRSWLAAFVWFFCAFCSFAGYLKRPIK